MKLSVSIPDDLWGEVSTVRSGLNPSHLIQEALRLWVSTQSLPAGYSTAAPVDVGNRLAALRERFANEAREEFEKGYRDALETADAFEWGDIDWLAENFHFNIKEWAHAWADSSVRGDLKGGKNGQDARKESALFRVVPGLMPPFGDDYPEPSDVYLRGFAQAMRDIWLDVSKGLRRTSREDGTVEKESGE
jgi:hypothetical protein